MLARDCTVDDIREQRVLNLALVRLIEIIGEAATRVSEVTRSDHPNIPWREIIAMRNRVIHGYDSVDFKILFDVVQLDLPPLIESLEALLAD